MLDDIPHDLPHDDLIELARAKQTNIDLREREACERSLIAFFERAWSEIGEPGRPSINWHHRRIASYLEDVAAGLIRDAIINQPPRTSKSSLVNIIWPAWIWAQPPERQGLLMGPHVKFLSVSYGATLAEDMAVKSRRLIMGEWYQRLWGDRVQIQTDQGSRSNFANTAGGERMSMSIEGGILGRGGDIQIIDDPHHVKGAESETQRRETLEGMRALSTRITDPRRSARVMVMQRLHCLLPGTMVRTPLGQEPVESLTTASKVLGSMGWQTVLATSTMPFKGDAYGVRLFGHPEVCWTTPNHRYLTRRGWQRADDLLADDWVRFPIQGAPGGVIPWEEPRRADPPAAPTGNFNGSNANAIGEDALALLVSRGVSNVAIGRQLAVHRNAAQCYLWLYQIGRIREANPWFGRAHLDDPLFWRLVGYWLAEGCFMRGRNTECGVRFTFHTKEGAYIADVETTLARYGIGTTKRYPENTPVCQMEASTSQLARWFRAHFGSGAKAKVLPEFIFGLPVACRAEVVEGWLRGDGCVRQTGPLAGQRSGASASIALIQGMQRLVHSLGQRAIIVQGRRAAGQAEIDGQQIISGLSWELRLSPEPRREGSMRSKIEDGAVWHQIRQIETKPYDGIVYDITTPTHDFVVGNATIHNTDDATNYAIENWRRDLVHVWFPMRYDETRPCVADVRIEDGELLWPEVWNEEAVAQEELELQEYGTAGQLQQAPVARGGGIIKREWWRLWPDDAEQDSGFQALYRCYGCGWKAARHLAGFSIECPSCGREAERVVEYPPTTFRMTVVDTAYGDKDENSFSAATTWGIWHGKEEDPRAMLMEAWRGRPPLLGDGKTKGLVEIVHGMASRRMVDVILIEKKTRGPDLYRELDRLLGRDHPWVLEFFEPTGRGDKSARLTSVQSRFIKDLVWAPAKKWADMVIDEVSSQPRAKFSDLTDTVSSALIYLRETNRLVLPAEHAAEVRRSLVFRGRSWRFNAGEMYEGA